MNQTAITLSRLIHDSAVADVPPTNEPEKLLLKDNLNIDSLGAADLCIEIEGEWGVEITMAEYAAARTIGDIAQLIDNKCQTAAP